ncbi:membrane protein [Arthrobacter phage Wheelbite]|uniref:Holin n=1 Tax=Arthrobacter phage Wheelbite TaxID=2015873 RepID=A0A222ZHG1_9CAUD|nr:holin [Arthrobacter phage Wheelbite]ASR84156.1 membrane protein [Arthrobacter phage Wheelbite]
MPEMLTQLMDQFPFLATVGGVIAVVVFIVAKIKRATKAVTPWVKKLTHLVEDLVGEEARPGVDARPGLMVRMQSSEQKLDAVTQTLEDHNEVLKELRPNHGGSIKDRIRDLHADSTDSKTRLGVLEGIVTAHLASCPPAPVPPSQVTVTTGAPMERTA